MKRLLWLTLAVVVGATAAAAQPSVALLGDDEGVSCNIVDNAPGIVQVHMFVYGVDGLAAIQFAAPIPACWTGATWVADQIVPDYLVLGGTQETRYGIAIATRCLDGGPNSPIYLGYMVVDTQGTAASCCEFPIEKANDLHPEVPGPIMVLCDQITEVVGVFESGTINANPDCGECLQIVPVEETTWGAVKALYGE
jgi:hypothetical protein